ncbi:50S ribosomal protein L14 [Candidatus Shikimatogenerans bostrichidophilus]|uniref:50S ribosomal protein L14 n=1 Tax=Candidatus Shikimatogenerans bostrichidophilus TaxID=2943807 RepID=UPI002966651E
MLQQESKLKVTDNSGAKEALIIRILGNKKYASIGDIIVVTIKKVLLKSTIKKGEIYKAIIVRVKNKIKRKDGTYILFDDNACILLNENKEIKGTRIFGPVSRELREKGYMKIISLSNYVI